MHTRVAWRCAHMVGALVSMAAVTAAAGCHWIIGVEDLPPIEAEPDGGQGPGPGDPLELFRLSPDTLAEGQGLLRPVPVVIEGRNIARTAMVRLIGPGQDEGLRPLVVADDGTLAAFELTIPVLEDLTDLSTQTIQVEVIQGDEIDTLTLTVDWLDELVASVYGASHDFTFVTEELAPRYSRIEIDRDMSSSGDIPLRLVATAELVLAAGLDASGAPAGIDASGAGGPGGCSGGAQGQNGSCSPGGGLGAVNGSQGGGGGGGGHETEGAMGTGAGAGIGGSPTGIAAMIDLRSEHGNGGGGGGNAGSGNAGGGGGGGGVIELASQGTFRIDPGAQITVRGGDGGTCSGTGANGGGGGGGGSGGGILLRSFRPIEDSTAANILVLDGGLGGAGQFCNGQGGAGARGRARVDAPALPSSTASATPHHGAVLDPDTPAIVRVSTLTVTVLGQSRSSYAVASDRTAPRTLSLDNQGRGTQSVDLARGMNRVCALVTPGTMRLSDGENCLDVAYVP